MSKLSIITPIYGSSKYLEKCLASLMKQNISDIEFIWIDNGANQECKFIIKKYINKNVKLIILDKNIGYLGAIIRGIKVASSDYIGFCDSDDWVYSDYYSNLYEKLVYSQSELAICPFTYVFDDHVSNRVQLIKFNGITSDFKSALNSISNGSLWNCLFKKTLFDLDFLNSLDGFNSFYTDNILLVTAIVRAKKIFLCNDIYYNYCQREKGTIRHLSKSQMSNSCRYIIDVLSSFLEKENVVSTEAIAAFLQRSIPLHTVSLGFLSKSYIFKNNLGILNHVKSSIIYYYPSFINKLFSVSVNKTKTKIRIRIFFVTFSIRV